MPIMIGLTGKARSGKDSVADVLAHRHDFIKMSFAGPIREFVAGKLLGITVQEMEPIKEEPQAILGGNTPRKVMQFFGTEFGREMVSQTLWVDVCMAQATRSMAQGYSVVISDARFDNEAEAIIEAGGIVVGLERPGNLGATSNLGHSSESGINPDMVRHLISNSGSLAELEAQTLSVLDLCRRFAA